MPLLDTNPIATPSTYITSPSSGAETIWVSAVNQEGCSTVKSFNLVLQTIVFNQIPIFFICDDNIRDGFTEFELDLQITPIITGVDLNLPVTYHLTEGQAEAGTNALPSQYTNIVNPEFIWVRVEDGTTGCYGAFEMQLFVSSPIAGTTTPLVECEEVLNEGFAEFDLLEDFDGDGFPDLASEIIGAQIALSVSYHQTEGQAEAGTNVLPSPYTNIIPYSQIIYARLFSTRLADCYDVARISTFTVRSGTIDHRSCTSRLSTV